MIMIKYQIIGNKKRGIRPGFSKFNYCPHHYHSLCHPRAGGNFTLLSLRAITDGVAIQSIMHARMRDFITHWIASLCSQ